MKLNDQTAVIIGGTGDIGRATARLFIEAGANVVIPVARKLTREREPLCSVGRHAALRSIRAMKHNYAHFLPRPGLSITSS